MSAMAKENEGPLPPPPPRAAAAGVRAAVTPTPATAAERDILDDQLDVLRGTLRGADVDETALEIATRLAEKGDDESVLRAHRLLAECGVSVGLWGMGATPEPRRKPKVSTTPVGAYYTTASQLRRDDEDDVDVEKVSLDVKGASTTSLAGAPPISLDAPSV